MTDYKVGDTVRIGEWQDTIKGTWMHGQERRCDFINTSIVALPIDVLTAMGAQIVQPEIQWQDGDVIAVLSNGRTLTDAAARYQDTWWVVGSSTPQTDDWASNKVSRGGWQRVTVTPLVGDSTLTRTTESQAQTLQPAVCACGHERVSHTSTGCWYAVSELRTCACTGYREVGA